MNLFKKEVGSLYDLRMKGILKYIQNVLGIQEIKKIKRGKRKPDYVIYQCGDYCITGSDYSYKK